jgi:hypothetical protein
MFFHKYICDKYAIKMIKQWHQAEKNGTKFEVVADRQDVVFIHQDTGSRGWGAGTMDYYLVLRCSRPQLKVESE